MGRSGGEKAAVPVYEFAVHAFTEIASGDGAGPAGLRLAVAARGQLSGPGAGDLRLATSAPAVSILRISAEDGAAVVAAGSPLGTVGAPVGLPCSLVLRMDEEPGREVGCHVVAIDGSPVGLIAAGPLDPGRIYRVVAMAEPEPLSALRQDTGAGDGTPPTVAPWEELFCFTHGTLIDTPEGPRPIEALVAGDLVTTLDNGSQPVRWIGRRRVARAEMLLRPEFQPILFEAGALGNTRPLLVSAQHRMLLDDWRAQVYFGEDQVLVAAKAMANGRTIRQVLPDDGVTYCHLLFDRHEIILAEGALSESFHPGETGLGAMDAELRREIAALFPELALETRRAAFPIVRPQEARALLMLST